MCNYTWIIATLLLGKGFTSKNMETLMLYLADAATLNVFFERHGGNKMLDNRVGPYNPKWVQCLDQ